MKKFSDFSVEREGVVQISTEEYMYLRQLESTVLELRKDIAEQCELHLRWSDSVAWKNDFTGVVEKYFGEDITEEKVKNLLSEANTEVRNKWFNEGAIYGDLISTELSTQYYSGNHFVNNAEFKKAYLKWCEDNNVESVLEEK